jgi:hypothetical protein
MVVDMGTRQSRALSDLERERWYVTASSSKKRRPRDAWYAPNSREPVRDETIREGLMPTGAVIERQGLPTTSGLGRYALAKDFADLFEENLQDNALDRAIQHWRDKHLSKTALARIALIKRGVVRTRNAVLVTYPNGHTRSLAPGPSSILSKAAIEEFAPRFLKEPAVLWLSESGSKVRDADDELARTLGIVIDPTKELPDIILVDLGASSDVLVVFVEVVATDGAVTARRRTALMEIAGAADLSPRHLAFVSVFADRASAAFRKNIASLAWNSFAWFASEPTALVILAEGSLKPISELRLTGA